MNPALDLNQIYPGRRVFGVGNGGPRDPATLPWEIPIPVQIPLPERTDFYVPTPVQIPPPGQSLRPGAGSFWHSIMGRLTSDTPFPATRARRRLGAGLKPRVKVAAQAQQRPPPPPVWP